ncbi:MAG: transcription-repair coupling factor, partial [Clostridiales bacterium]|nr:transcription-repair coupling factor [Clostridiales bacterium]
MTPDAPAGYGPAKKSLAPDSEAAGERRRQLGEFRESLCGPLLAWAEFRALLSGISGGAGPIALRGVADAQRAHFACALEQCSGRRVLYIAPNEYDAQAAFADFYALYGHEAVYFPAREIVLYDIEARNHDIAYRRLRALDRLLSGDCRVCVTSAEAAAQFIPPPRLFSSMIMSASEGDAVDLDFAARRLVEMGYERVQTVEARGAFAIRGGLLDIYPVDYEYALRIELFGDEIDSMRLFDAASQRSVEQVRRARIIPARDTAYREADREGIVSRIRREMAAGGRGAPSGRSMPAVEADIQKFAESHYFPGIDRYLAYIYDGQPTLLDYFFAGEAAGGAAAGGAGAGEGMAGGAAGGGGAAGRGAAGSAVAMAPGAGGGMVGGTGASGGATGSAASVGAPPPLVVIDDPPRAAQKLETVLSEHAELCSGFMEKGKLLASAYKVWLDFAELAQRLPRAGLVTIGLSRTAREDELLGGRAAEFDVSGKTHVSPRGNVAMLLDEMRGRLREQWAVVLLTKSGMKAERLQDALRGAGLPVRRPAGNAGAPSAGAPASGAANGAEGIVALPVAALPAAGFVNVMAGAALSSGFEYPAIKLMVISDAEFQSQERQAKKNRRAPKGSKIEYFTDLALGDYVVHQSHGVGVYAGLERLEVDGAVREYLKVQYRDGDYLYIPTDQLDLVQKYIGSEGRAPRVNSLDSAEWSKTKKRVKESLKKLAAELILIYARRRDARGYAFSKDTVWQGQFEEQFPYEETGDQLQSIEEIKRDMESPRVMDRLLCGDVGFGKTEVAIRAVFKAVSDGAQVVFLVPTTVLAQQHYLTFRERFKDFPISIDVLSRFRTKKELDGIAKALEQGGIDVIIGTHRIILNKDIRFKNLRLLIVDEEQRFGVAHKERLKLMKPDVDVLSMSATPIPRTLHMSMTKIRDISVLKDPPEERFPVQTFVMEYDEGVVREAILREVARGGQVFYLYNRVMGIDIKMMQLKDMLPDGVRIAYAHGRMGDRELEDIMLAFIERRFDVLVCTTIIESGLDMPNVNTIVVEDADRMGLSQLYQLRGRVGRSNRLAYAYITHRRDKVLTEESEKRLKAIREFTELGAGFKIAMRDMEIRGIGNLLGTEQHGHMESVGYDMYCRLLDEAVRELERAGGPAAGGAWGASADGGVDAGG